MRISGMNCGLRPVKAGKRIGGAFPLLVMMQLEGDICE
jgi:hypothetical protein